MVEKGLGVENEGPKAPGLITMAVFGLKTFGTLTTN